MVSVKLRILIGSIVFAGLISVVGMAYQESQAQELEIDKNDGIIGTYHQCDIDDTVYFQNVSEPNVNYTLPNCI
jgi:hypothetical protein